MTSLEFKLLTLAFSLAVQVQAADSTNSQQGVAEPATTAPTVNSALAPQGPLIKRMPDFSSWRINFYYAKDKEKASPEHPVDYGLGVDPDFLPAPLRQITLTRTKPRYVAVSVDVKGTVLEQSSDGVQEFLHNPRSGLLRNIIRDPTTPLRICDFSKIDFPDLEWVSKETFKGTQRLGELDCLVFQNEGTTAWIDSRTRFPVLWRKAGETRTFQQLPPPAGIVQLPLRAQELSEEYQKVREQIMKPRPRGG